MKDFFDKLNSKIEEFMGGRYGLDEYGRFSLIVTLILFVFALFVRNGWLNLIAALCLIYSYWRILSRDSVRRSAENERYLALREKLRKAWRIQKKRFDSRKEYRFFKCPSCGQQVRVPRGKGRIRITCPRCHTQFDRTV